mgnify:CR=1 FL=1
MGFFDLFKKKQDNAPSAQQPAEQAAELKREREELAEGLQKTKSGLFSKLARAVAGRSTVDVEVLDNLEEVLITSDVGVETTVKIIRSIEERIARDKYMNTSELNAILRDEIASLLEQSHTSTEDFGIEVKEGTPYVMMVVGVNGAGKTTTIGKIGPLKFLLGTTWKPGNDIYGILPMILGSIYVTAGAIIVGVPIGLLTAIYMSRFASPRINKVLLPAVQLLAGIPSVVYGFFGMIVMVPAVQAMVKSDFFKTVLHVKSGKGMSLFTASLLLGIMILPTIITVSKTSLDAVPQSYYEGSLALGATHERSVFCAVLPAAKSGVMSAVILGVGRAIGETMAVVMVAGNQTWMPKGLFQGLRTMTSNIVIEMGYAADLHREALIATGVVLFVFILLINLCFSLVKGGEKNG